MALNAASHNIAGVKTGPVSGDPPPVSDETKDAVLGNSQQEATGQSAPGQDGGDKTAPKKEKTAKESETPTEDGKVEKERQKAEKDKKFQEKQAKKAAAALQQQQQPSKKKEKKEAAAKEEKLPEYVEETPRGEKKILKPLDDVFHKAYIPRVVESAWNDWWEKEGFFQPDFEQDGEVKKPGHFVIVIPPPNVTGALHCGHAMATSLQDVLIRWHRMRGFTTLYLPGCDHAGIATQNVVENMLWRRENKTRHDLGREEFVKRAWTWKGEYHEKINRVLRRLGGSFDWTREAFTMNDNLSAAVTETFVRMHEEGYIYRENRLVNWCGRLNTALSNLEVDNKEIDGPTKIDVPGYDKKIEFGVLTYFKYPIEGTDEFITVATTRPETMLGDTGIAVNPNDERYKSFIGKAATHPFIPDRKLPIFADDYVDTDFGTGAVKITPAHDPNDFKMGKDHKLEFINILTDDGKLNENAGKFQGQRRFDARYTVVKELTEKGLFVKTEPNPMKIPLCSRSKDVIEPLLKPQWWMRMNELNQNAIKAVREGQVKIRPESAEKNYFRWLESDVDWCLSRQLWWGHRCPAYLVDVEGEQTNPDLNESWVTGRTKEEAQKKAEKQFPGKKFELKQDPDVLDTWFSSGLWPFSTLGWPNETHDFEKLFPTSVLETGWDILFFWVARMIILSIHLTGKVPFNEVFCHSLIRDSEGRKMSKSLGNVIDPVDVMDGITLNDLHGKLLTGNLDPKELKTATKYQDTNFPEGIPECGADALRFSLVQYTTGGGDVNFDVKVMHGYRRFCNKVYQATKYVLGKLDSLQGFKPAASGGKTGKESLAERWILHKLNAAAKDIDKALADREFSKSTQIAYDYWYKNLCDVYIENSKAIIQEGSEEERKSAVDTLYTALEGGLTMIHPFMPFLSEELWQRLPRRPGDSTPSIVVASYPQYNPALNDPESEAAYELLLGCSKGIRSLLADYKILDEGKAFVHCLNETAYETASSQSQAIRSLSGKGLASISVLAPSDEVPTGCAVFVVSADAAIFLEVKGRVDVDQEIKKAQQKLQKASTASQKQKKLMDSEDFKNKASQAVMNIEKEKLADLEAEIRNYEATVGQFEKMKL